MISIRYGKYLMLMIVTICTLLFMSVPAFAVDGESGGGEGTQTGYTEDVWGKAEEILDNVYSKLVSLSTVAAAVAGSVAAFFFFFSSNQHSVDMAKMWGKRVLIGWCILNGLGLLFKTLAPFFSGTATLPG